MKKRCEWAGKEGILIDYHDTEWGVPIHDSELLFQYLLLDGVQAGLSWITVLKKRENYRQAFDNFDPYKMAELTDEQLEKHLLNKGIIRNRLKVFGFRKNALAYLQLTKDRSFSNFLWDFVDGKTITNSWTTSKERPTTSPESDLMSKSLKQAGFTFVGSTICYAFMQAVGMVNDHTLDCFRYHEVN